LRTTSIPTFEDKVLQRAVSMILGAVYEQDFKDCSYGFRPGRSAHQALQALWEGLMKGPGGWVLELDIEDFFGSLDHQRLRAILRRRVRDGVLLRLIGKWLRAGVMEEGNLTHLDTGTPQGGVISPLLANVYLHEVLDEWFCDVVRPRMRGMARMVRYADDAVLVFAREEDVPRGGMARSTFGSRPSHRVAFARCACPGGLRMASSLGSAGTTRSRRWPRSRFNLRSS